MDFSYVCEYMYKNMYLTHEQSGVIHNSVVSTIIQYSMIVGCAGHQPAQKDPNFQPNRNFQTLETRKKFYIIFFLYPICSTGVYEKL